MFLFTNNVKLKILCNKEDFINYYLTVGNTNVANNTNGINPSSLLFGNSVLPYYVYKFNSSQVVKNAFILLLSNIYDIFMDSIPYQQSVDNVQIVNLDNKILNVNLPDILLTQIGAYIGIYIQDILNWYFNIEKMIIANNQVINEASRTVTTSTNTDTIGQNQSLNKDSFNPVQNNSNATINAINTKQQAKGGLSFNNYTVNDAANWTTNTAANSENNQTTETVKELDLTQLRVLGNERMNTYLMPLFKKIGTLFWVLGDSSWNEPAVGGFNIW